MTRHWLLLFALLSTCTATAAAQEPRYVAVFTDGSRVEGKGINGWSSSPASAGPAAPTGPLRLDTTPLFSPGRPLRWLLDRTLPQYEAPTNSRGFIELVNGDRLPGTVVRIEQPGTRSPDRDLVVALEWPTGAPGGTGPEQVRVLAQFVRRIVRGKDMQRTFPPSTLLYRDGRELSFRALRWQSDAVEVLVPDGIRRAGLTELAEIVLPPADPWQGYCDELALVNPDLSARLIRLETIGGMILTTSECVSRRTGAENDRENWQYQVQPAWSLDVISLPFATIRSVWSFAAHEWRLSRFRPARVVRRPLLVQGLQWQLDRNVHGGPLRNQTQEHGWGFGVHAPCELWFELPRQVQAFRTRAGLDAIARNGGCARALVYLNQCRGSPLFRSDLLIGSSSVADTGNLVLDGPADGPKTLVLVADAAAREGPPGADPLDIRDMLDWIEPMLLLDPERLKADVQQRSEAPLAGDGWTVKLEGGGAPRWRARFEDVDAAQVKLLRGISTDGRPLTLARQQEIPATADGLLLSVRQASGGSQGRLEFRVDGRAVARCDVPVGARGLPLFVSLKPYSGRQVHLEIFYQPGGAPAQRVDDGLFEVQSLAWASRADLSFWRPAAPSDAWSLCQLPVRVESDGTVRVGRDRPGADIEVVRAQCGLRQIHGFRLEFMPEGDLFNASGPTDEFRLGVSLAVAPRRQEPVPGRYVRIEVPPGANYPVLLGEVEVYRDSVLPAGPEKEARPRGKDPKAQEKAGPPGPVPRNMARKGTASQSSVEGDAVPQRAIDGSGHSARTRSAGNGDPSPWWEVDLGGMKPIDRIVVQKDTNWKQEYLWRNKPYWVLVLDDRRNTVWKSCVENLVSTEDLPVMAHRNWLVGACPPGETAAAPDRVGDETAYRPTYWTMRPPGSCEPLWFFPEKPVGLADKEPLLVSIKQVGRRGGQILGHFRLWLTADRAPRGAKAAAVEVPLLP
jgi:hypothetical protein